MRLPGPWWLLCRATDPDGGDILTFSIIGGTGASLFEIVGNELRVKVGAVFTFGTNPTVDIQVADTTVIEEPSTQTIC